jgi:hypothetical protein
MKKLNKNYSRTYELLTKVERPTLLNLSQKHVDRLVNLITENFMHKGFPSIDSIKELFAFNDFIISESEIYFIYSRLDEFWAVWHKPQTHKMIGERPHEFLHMDGTIHCATIQTFQILETGEIYEFTNLGKAKNRASGIYTKGQTK